MPAPLRDAPRSAAHLIVTWQARRRAAGSWVVGSPPPRPLSRSRRRVDVPSFIRTYHIRAPQVMWFLGAGASAAARIPTAGAMVWDFKRKLYCSAQRVSPDACRDLGSPEVQARLHAYLDALGSYPPRSDADEYAAYFEAVYPAAADRRRYVQHLVERGVPSYGHVALAALLVAGTSRVVWTTNFDRVVEEAVLPVAGGPARLTVATPDTAHVALDALNEGRWPLLVKLHGDFQSRRLKNTREELREQDAKLRRALLQACRSGGLAVVGFSGRDDSVMRVFEDALVEDGEAVGAFPAGLFWFHRASDGAPAERVTDLLARARAAGVEAHRIDVETFDELLGDVAGQLDDPPPAVRALLAARPSHVSDAPIPAPGEGFPVIRLNALPITHAPEMCRLAACEIGNTREVREAVTAAGASLIVARRRTGVLVFGADAEVRRSFAAHGLRALDLHPIETRRLFHADSAELGMLLEALAYGIARMRPVRAVRRRGRYLLVVDSTRAASERTLALLGRVTQGLAGRHRVTTAAGSQIELAWAEAVSIRLEHRLGRLWLLLEPTVWMERAGDDVAVRAAGDFVRERRARRYNDRTSDLLDAWTNVLSGGGETARVTAFGLADGEGVDATFEFVRSSAFSRAPRVAASRSADLARAGTTSAAAVTGTDVRATRAGRPSPDGGRHD